MFWKPKLRADDAQIIMNLNLDEQSREWPVMIWLVDILGRGYLT